MHAEVFDLGAELLHWRRSYPHGAHFGSGLPFERYIATLKFGYDNFLRHHKQDLAKLKPSLHQQYQSRVAMGDRVHWEEAELIVTAVWERMHGNQRQWPADGSPPFTACHAVQKESTHGHRPIEKSIEYLDDEQWERINEVLVGGQEPRIRGNRNQRHFIDAVLWVAHHRECWSNLPSAYGHSHNTYVHFNRWMKLGLWEPVAAILHYTPHARVFADLIRSSCRKTAIRKGAKPTR